MSRVRKTRRRRSRKSKKSKKAHNPQFEVERIIDERIDPITGSASYLVKWEGYPVEESTWEPLDHLQSCSKLVDEFYQEKARILEERQYVKITRARGDDGEWVYQAQVSPVYSKGGKHQNSENQLVFVSRQSGVSGDGNGMRSGLGSGIEAGGGGIGSENVSGRKIGVDFQKSEMGEIQEEMHEDGQEMSEKATKEPFGKPLNIPQPNQELKNSQNQEFEESGKIQEESDHSLSSMMDESSMSSFFSSSSDENSKPTKKKKKLKKIKNKKSDQKAPKTSTKAPKTPSADNKHGFRCINIAKGIRQGKIRRLIDKSSYHPNNDSEPLETAPQGCFFSGDLPHKPLELKVLNPGETDKKKIIFEVLVDFKIRAENGIKPRPKWYTSYELKVLEPTFLAKAMYKLFQDHGLETLVHNKKLAKKEAAQKKRKLKLEQKKLKEEQLKAALEAKNQVEKDVDGTGEIWEFTTLRKGEKPFRNLKEGPKKAANGVDEVDQGNGKTEPKMSTERARLLEMLQAMKKKAVTLHKTFKKKRKKSQSKGRKKGSKAKGGARDKRNGKKFKEDEREGKRGSQGTTKGAQKGNKAGKGGLNDQPDIDADKAGCEYFAL